MIFKETKLAGVYVIEMKRFDDARGFFANTFLSDEFKKYGLPTEFSQCSVSYNNRKGTLRGMHHQVAPHTQAKLIRCTLGAVYDVVLDLRKDSKTFGQWIGKELSQENRRAIFIPPGLAHGFQTVSEPSEIFYQITGAYAPEFERAVRWNDPSFNIKWPIVPPLLSEKDSKIADYQS